MRGNRFTSLSLAMRRLAVTSVATVSAFAAAAAPASAAVEGPINVRKITATSAELCKNYVNIAAERSVVYDASTPGAPRVKVAQSTSQCTVVGNLTPARSYRFELDSGNIGVADADLRLLGSADVQTPPLLPRKAVATSVSEITGTSAKICATGIRPAVVTEFAVFDGDRKLVSSTARCNVVTGLRPSTRYAFSFRSGSPGNEASWVDEGDVYVRTFSVYPSQASTKDVTATSATVCDDSAPTGARRYAVYRVFGYGTRQLFEKLAESESRCTSVTLASSRSYILELRSGPVGSSDDDLGSLGQTVVRTLTASGAAPPIVINSLTDTAVAICSTGSPSDGAKFALYSSGTKIGEAPVNCVSANGLTPGTTYELELRKAPYSNSGEGQFVTVGSLSVTTATKPDPVVPAIEARSITRTSALVCGPEDGYNMSIFDIYDGATQRSTSRGDCQIVRDLTPGTTYTLTYAEKPFLGTEETPAGPGVTLGTVTFTTLPGKPVNPMVDFSFDFAGTASVKTLTVGSVPLSGSLQSKIDVSTGSFSGPLTIAPTTAKLISIGFLPVTANMNLVPTEPVTGALVGGKLTAVAKVRIKLPSVKVLGIELAGGANCQAKQISSIPLASTRAEFVPVDGGPVAGTFAISNLTGCGFLTDLVSPLTSGSGNALALNLTNRAS